MTRHTALAYLVQRRAAPAGSYSSNRAINNGLGRWAEMFGLGAIGYVDADRSWSMSAMTRYLTHQSQQGVDIRVGDDFVLEWGLGKTFRPPSWKPWVAQLDTGVVGYAQWQVTDNRGSDIPNPLRGIRSSIFAGGPRSPPPPRWVASSPATSSSSALRTPSKARSSFSVGLPCRIRLSNRLCRCRAGPCLSRVPRAFGHGPLGPCTSAPTRLPSPSHEPTVIAVIAIPLQHVPESGRPLLPLPSVRAEASAVKLEQTFALLHNSTAEAFVSAEK